MLLHFRSEQRKQNDLADGLCVGQQHHESVDADTQSTGGRHAVPQCADEIVVHFGHRVFFRLAGELLRKELFLEVRVVQLGISVGQFHSLDEQFESFGNFRVVLLPLGQRTDAGRVVVHEDWPGQSVFNLFFEQFVLHYVDVLAGCLETDLVGQSDDARLVGRLKAGVLGEEFVIGLSLERRP